MIRSVNARTFFAVTVVGLLGPPLVAAQADAVVPINGLAHQAVGPLGPDLQPAGLVAFQARNPTAATWAATVAQRARFLSPAQIPPNIQVSHDGQVPGASRPVTDFSEVMVVLDPTDPLHLLGSSKFFYQPQTYRFHIGVFESMDGGLTWAQQQPNGIETYSLTSDPVNTFDHLGNGYFTLLTRGPTGVDVMKKPAGGAWGPPVPVDRTTAADKQWLVGDQDPQGRSPNPGRLYVSWTNVGSGQGSRPQIVLAHSTDANGSWSPPLLLASGSVQGSVPGVDPDGAVTVVYGTNLFGGNANATVEVVKSTDGGETFGSAVVIARFRAVPFQLPNTTFRAASLPALAISPSNGHLFASWADYGNGDADVYLARSEDGGASWSTPVRLNDDPVANGVDQFMPQVAVASNGRVAVIWFDRRLPCPALAWIPADHVGDENTCIDTFLTRSVDDGLTWEPNARVSAQTWDSSLNLPLTGNQMGFIGDYQGLASSNDFDFPFWNATANLGENPGNHQQVFVARVPAPAAPTVTPPTPTPTLRPPTATATATAGEATPTVQPPGEAVQCELLADRVPPAAIHAALANPASVEGWNELCYPNRPPDPFNVPRRSLSLKNPGLPYHPIYNGLVFRCGCP